MAAEALAERIFTLADQHAFARLSRDANPIHVDPVAARRGLAGAPLVHGVHLLMWGLEALYGKTASLPPLASLRVNFEKMVPVGAPVRAVLVDIRDDRLRLDMRCEGQTAVTVVVGFAAPTRPYPRPSASRRFDPSEPLAHSEADLAGLSGKVAPFRDGDRLSETFPSLAGELGAQRLAGLAAMTFLVGMVCPGLNSLFRSIDLAATGEAGDDALDFQVVSLETRFHMLRMAVSGYGWAGRLDAHIRPAPIMQPDIATISARVGDKAFAGVRALVVGGSRGLGEVLAKILAAGSAEVAITYRIGEADALRVAREISAADRQCRVFRYDAAADDPALFRDAGFLPNQLYYMATPVIRPAHGPYSPARFADYAALYVNGFARLAEALAADRKGALAVFYPSTVFVEDAPAGFTEYAMAKVAGEVLCHGLKASGTVGSVLMERLPRLLTDQTRTFSEESFPDTVATLAAIVTKMGEAGREQACARGLARMSPASAEGGVPGA